MSSPLLPSVLGAIGETPLVELSRITRGLEGRILAKLEYLNPGFSKKDRIALQIVEDAEADGLLRPGQTVVELTSGNTGTGLAIVCGVKGYPFVAVMSSGNSIERARMMSALGAEVVLVDQLPGSVRGQVSGGDLALVEQEAQRITRERGAFRADQFRLESNVRAHLLHTAPELLRQAGGRIDAFCDFAGTGGSFTGCAMALKWAQRLDALLRRRARRRRRPRRRAASRTRATESRGAATRMSELPLLRRDLVDGFLSVSDDEAIATARRLAREEGIFAGFSSGANVAAALRLLSTTCRGKTVAVLLCDSGLKYLSTDLWR